MYSMQINATSY